MLKFFADIYPEPDASCSSDASAMGKRAVVTDAALSRQRRRPPVVDARCYRDVERSPCCLRC